MDKDFRDIHQILNRILANYNIEKPVIKRQLFDNWENILGKELSEKCNPIKIEGETLYLKAKNSIWRNELKIREKDLLKIIQKKIDKNIITKLRFF